MICYKFRKIIAGILMGFGIAILLILFLPQVAWMFIIGVGMFVGGIKYLFGKWGGRKYDYCCEESSKSFKRNS